MRLAEKRTNAVIDKIRILSNCANPYAYEWEEDDVRKMFQAIDNEVRIAKVKFQSARRRSFKLT